jgi:hypothetical protein
MALMFNTRLRVEIIDPFTLFATGNSPLNRKSEPSHYALLDNGQQ